MERPTGWARLRPVLRSEGPGPLVARTFHALLACVFLCAFASLASQIDVLVGSRGLLPAAPFLDALQRGDDVPWYAVPTLFWWWPPSDASLRMGLAVGLGFSLAALLGLFPRACIAASVLVYLSYVTICREFLAFQWDNLLIEAGFLAVLLPRERRANWIHWLFRLLLFKLYWESGLAKWQSGIGDWRDGSAMTFYYETAPLPTWLGWYAHHLPEAWQHLESRLTLALELGLSLAILAPRPFRLAALVGFMGLQILNLATANYGFFVYLSLALHVFLLDDRDIAWLRALVLVRLRRRRAGRQARPVPSPRGPFQRRAAVVGAALVACGWIVASLVEAAARFTDSEAPRTTLLSLRRAYTPFHLANTYHLFASVTRQRVEPDFQTFDPERGIWVPQPLRYKPGPVDRRPSFVAPHQPRVDFRLWFYGLSFRGGLPDYVATLIERMCRDPAAVQSLFVEPLPKRPPALRLAFWDTRFSSPDERAASGVWWTRELLGTSRRLRCASPSREQ